MFFIVYDLEMHKYAIALKRKSNTQGLVHEHRPNKAAKLMGVDFRINSLGFRDVEMSPEKKDSDYRIMVLGCSNTVGWGVPYENVFTTLIEEKLNRDKKSKQYQVINAGVGNYNTYLESIQLMERITQIDPNMVVLHYYINDAEIISDKDAGMLIKNSYLIAFMKNRLKYFAFKRNYIDLGAYYLQLYQPDSEGWISAQKSLLDIKKNCLENNADFLVALQPDLHNLSKESGQYKCHKIISSFLKTHNINHIDLMGAYRKGLKRDLKSLWVHPDDAHPNEDGHGIIFDALFPVVDSIAQ